MLAEKQRIASALGAVGTGRRLLLVSGSSTHFGISAADLESALGLPTINYGSHAEMSFSVILGNIKRLVRPGDVVLLSPEYERYSGPGLNDVMIDYLFACAVDTLRGLPWMQQVEAAFALSATRAMAGIAMKLGLDAIAEKLAYMNLPLPLGERYSDDVQIGPRGDAIVNRRAAITPMYRRRVAEAAAPPVVFEADSDEVQAITSFVVWATAHDVRVLATWPNMVNFPSYRTPAARAFFHRIKEFYGALGVTVVGTPEAVLFDVGAFFDHHYHLHRDAVARRTAALIPTLRNALAAPAQ